MVIYGSLTGFHGDLMVISWWFNGDIMVIYGSSTGFNGDMEV